MALHDSYPQFSNGDVEILFGNRHRYVLHANILRRLPFFEAALSSRWNDEQGPSRRNGKIRWVYELRFDENESLSLLHRKNIMPPPDTELIGCERETAGLHAERLICLEAHQNLLGALYSLRPTFCHQSLEQARNSMLLFSRVAGLYGGEAVAEEHIKDYLYNHRNDVLYLCAKDAVGMIAFAMDHQSDWIFQEAATNLLGAIKYEYDAARPVLAELEISDLFDRRRKDFEKKLLNHESALQLLGLPRPTVLSDEEHLRHAVVDFQNWMQYQLRRQKVSHLSPGYANLYHKIAAIDQQLQTKHEQIYEQITVPRSERVGALKDFLYVVEQHLDKMSPPLDRGDELKDYLYVVERYVQALFRKAKDIIRPLLQDRTRLQAGPAGGLKCIMIGDNDLPWVVDRTECRLSTPAISYRRGFCNELEYLNVMLCLQQQQENGY